MHTRYTDNEHRVALRVTREGVQLINRGAEEPSPLPVVFAAHQAATGVWYDVLARTVGEDILVWIRRQDSPYTLEQATVFTPPLDFRVQGEPNAEVGQLLHTDSARLRVGFNTQPSQPILPGAIALRGLAVRALPCAEDAFPRATHTPCADVVISEIYPHVPEPPHCVDLDGDSVCEQTLEHPWIELWVPGENAVDVSGWGITDTPELPVKYVFPTPTVLAPGFHVLELAVDAEDPSHRGFTLGEADTLYLLCVADSGGEKSTAGPHQWADSLVYPPLPAGQSYALIAYHEGAGRAETSPRPAAPTPGSQATPASAGPHTWNLRVATTTRIMNMGVVDFSIGPPVEQNPGTLLPVREALDKMTATVNQLVDESNPGSHVQVKFNLLGPAQDSDLPLFAAGERGIAVAHGAPDDIRTEAHWAKWMDVCEKHGFNVVIINSFRPDANFLNRAPRIPFSAAGFMHDEVFYPKEIAHRNPDPGNKGEGHPILRSVFMCVGDPLFTANAFAHEWTHYCGFMPGIPGLTGARNSRGELVRNELYKPGLPYDVGPSIGEDLEAHDWHSIHSVPPMQKLAPFNLPYRQRKLNDDGKVTDWGQYEWWDALGKRYTVNPCAFELLHGAWSRQPFNPAAEATRCN